MLLCCSHWFAHRTVHQQNVCNSCYVNRKPNINIRFIKHFKSLSRQLWISQLTVVDYMSRDGLRRTATEIKYHALWLSACISGCSMQLLTLKIILYMLRETQAHINARVSELCSESEGEPKYLHYSIVDSGESREEVIMWKGRLFLIITLHNEEVTKARSYILTFGSVSFLSIPPSHWGKVFQLRLFPVRHTHVVVCSFVRRAYMTVTLKCQYYHGKARGDTHCTHFLIICLLVWVCTVWNLASAPFLQETWLLTWASCFDTSPLHISCFSFSVCKSPQTTPVCQSSWKLNSLHL